MLCCDFSKRKAVTPVIPPKRKNKKYPALLPRRAKPPDAADCDMLPSAKPPFASSRL